MTEKFTGNIEQRHICKKCGKNMLNVPSKAYIDNGSLVTKTMWWCACGEIDVDATEKKSLKYLWNKINQGKADV